MALLLGGVVPADGAVKEDARSPGPSGVFLVCKEYGTVRGTFVTSVRGRDMTRLNFLFGEDVNPRFSPADDRVLFTSARGGTPGLWTMNRNGEDRKRICDGDQGDWFPDGRRIAVARRGRIFVRSLASGEETPVSPAGRKSCSSPACSPDGRKVLFLARDGAEDALCLVTLGQPEPKRLAEGEIFGSPRWAPEGQRIVYQHGAHLCMIDADGSNRRQLTTSGGIQRRPAWSPDGTAIAYCQGPGPDGPWQMAVIHSDGTRRRSIPPGDARSVLCSDWGLERPGQKAEPKGTGLRPAPRIQLWKIDQPPTAPHPDWRAFCRERKGWGAVPAEKALRESLRGGCAVENQDAVLLLLPGMPGPVLIPKPSLQGPIEFTLLDRQGRKAGPVESIRLLTCGADEAALESSAQSAGEPVKAAWAIGGSRALVQVTPRENAGKLRVDVPMQCIVLPDRFANDLVVDPEALSQPRAVLPWAPLVTALCGNGSGMFVLVCPGQGQRAELRKDQGPSFAGADVAFENRGLYAGAIAQERSWHLERFGSKGPADPLRFQWRMPCPAAWRLAVQGEGQRFSTFFCDKESSYFDKKDVLFRKGKAFSAAVRLGAIYLCGRTAATPPDTLTPVDLVRDAIGLASTAQALDEEGVTGYRKAARTTTWAELSATVESLRYLFERQIEVQDSVYAGHLCDDLPRFVEGMDQRLKEYADFARQIEATRETLKNALPASAKFWELERQHRALNSPEELLPLATKIKQLTARESGTNREEFEKCCRAIRRVVEPREELLNAYRKLAIEVRDAAGIAPLAHPELLGPAERIRALCQGVLRNRLYAEADWRGEDYRVPAFWLGPRPYQDAR